ncbi:MAG TPA: hypothetical protein VGB45_04520 [Abditibacterium sp.]
MSPFCGSVAAWQHSDGTFCAPCTSSPLAPVLDDDCESESLAAPNTAASDDCRKCCSPTPQPAPDKLISQSFQVAILSALFAFKAPIRGESRLSYAFVALSLDNLPRPPPRGRAPPLWLLISPFCTLEI